MHIARDRKYKPRNCLTPSKLQISHLMLLPDSLRNGHRASFDSNGQRSITKTIKMTHNVGRRTVKAFQMGYLPVPWVGTPEFCASRLKSPWSCDLEDNDRDALSLDADACWPHEIGVDSLVNEADLAQVLRRFRRMNYFVGWKPRRCNTP